MAHLAYFDESVDDDFFVLASVIMHESDWADNLDKVLALRRRARRRHGISVTKEIKAKHIRRVPRPAVALRMVA